jgi:thioredoxin 1
MQIVTNADFQSFLEAKPAALIRFDAKWDVAYAPALQRRMQEAEQILADQVNFGEVDCDADPELAMSIPILNVPTVAYYRNGQLVVALVGAEQNVAARAARVLRGEPIEYQDGLD